MTSGAIDNNSKRIQRTDQVHEKICVQAMYDLKVVSQVLYYEVTICA